ncbi:unnamed protein product [Thelazia callipaeda]|uniref:GrpE protein homolog n=1 Tax=Thelazia callipaeda TaxID=103827 RepID=A0A0N5D761_THECL|nr:unnamed protein product [Thelazia callipaeda]
MCMLLKLQCHFRLLLKENFSTTATRLSFSATAQKDLSKETTSFSLKCENARLTSGEFFAKIKESVGSDANDEEFTIPRPAYDALAAEYDVLLEEIATFKISFICMQGINSDIYIYIQNELQLLTDIYIGKKLLIIVDKYIRAIAEIENVRRRGQKQTEETKVFAIQGFCKDLLEVADILDLAISAVGKEELENNVPLKNLFEGLEMTRTLLQKAFMKHGLKQISPEGEKFDPTLHEAVFQVPKEQSKLESGSVAQVIKIGYALQNRPIRAAKVGVVQ